MTSLPGTPCAVCRRSTHEGRALSTPDSLTHFCCDTCIKAWIMRGPNIVQNERSAAIKGGEAAGVYLEEIGKTDLADMTEGEWAEFCTRLYVAACDALREWADDSIPF